MTVKVCSLLGSVEVSATLLLMATKEKADRMCLPCVGLLVDKGNPSAERLYTSVGFRYANDSSWGGHPMKHLVL